MSRKYLLLQGPVGPFFGILARHMQSAGLEVLKVNFNGGDEHFYSNSHITGTSIDFEDSLEKWPVFLEKLAKQSKITDLVIYGDCRPIHKSAIQILKPLGVKVHVLEEGYFRPNWVTYEEDGVNYYSHLPREAEFYRTQLIMPQTESVPVKPVFGAMAWYVTQYYFAHIPRSLLGRYKKYKLHFCGGNHHKAFWPWVPKLLQKPLLKIEAHFLQAKILKEKYFLVPLQLCRDFQITEHSNFADMQDFIKFTIANFVLSAPEGVKLVIKSHPLDPALCKLRKAIKRTAAENKATDRVMFIDGGHLPTLLEGSLGLITVNSTAGLQAIHHNVPTLVLGRSFYSIEGLVNKVEFAEFVHNPKKPDMKLYSHFRNYVMRNTQIGGSFYEKRGMERAAAEITNKLKA